MRYCQIVAALDVLLNCYLTESHMILVATSLLLRLPSQWLKRSIRVSNQSRSFFAVILVHSMIFLKAIGESLFTLFLEIHHIDCLGAEGPLGPPMIALYLLAGIADSP